MTDAMRGDFTVLMSMYAGSCAEHVTSAFDSLWHQTVEVPSLVLVIDGPIGIDLEDAVVGEQTRWGRRLRVCRLSERVGLSRALNEGLRYCETTWIARMDADDVVTPDRMAIQLETLESFPDTDLLGSWYLEMDADLVHPIGIRRVPEAHQEIVRYARLRTPFNHPTIFVRRLALLAIGGYPTHETWLEDWWLALRLIHGGFKLRNIARPLVHVRGGEAFHARRRGLRYASAEVRDILRLRIDGLLGTGAAVASLLVRVPPRLLPSWLLRFLYARILRSPAVLAAPRVGG